ncbi:MAG: aa3-type cytochrome c oxidase subunit IV [Sphingobium sp.]|nr:aa3-type cytochrome c oxidase subunit IV [Sphingobium sp.]
MATQNDMEMAQHTYRGFIWFVKWGTLAVALIAILVVLLIS